ncbi:MAG: sigma-70 family RNA polymerase sigma factor [Oscillospiraceae bacterium]|jgi:RNA polymerase sigma factor (sigma-70 family)|nr:sigma-70 family RNA polymerase sigma factor [Oscillospiraceae bacterium]
MARYAYLLSEENTNTQEMDRVKLALWRALHEDITEKQRQYLLLYYGEGMNMGQIGRQMGVDKSTVSRTIKRGEERLRRCLRYGAKRFLADEEPPRAMTAGKGGCYYQRRG